MKTVIITRFKLLPTPGTNYRFAWKWAYHVNGDHATDTLASARDIAKRLFPGATIVEAWKVREEKT